MNFPRQSIAENKKDEEFHKDCIRSLVTYNNEYGMIKSDRVKDHENFCIVDGIFDHKQFEFMTDMYGITAPARLVNYPMIAPRLELLAGELLSQGLEFTTNVINREAIARKNEKKMGIASEMLMRPIRKEMEAMLGMKIPDEDIGEEIPKDIEEYQNYKYREAVEVDVHYGMKFLIQKYDLPQTFKRGFYQLMVTNKEFYKVYVKNGDPYVKNVDTRKMIYDKDSDEEFLQHSQYAGDQTWYSINELIDRFKFNKKQIQELEELANKERNYFDELNSGFQWYRFEEGGKLSICVTEMQWRSIRMMNYKVSKNPYDNETPFYKLLPDDYKPNDSENIESYGTNDVRKGILIGHDMLIEWGRKTNQYRPEENYQKTTLDYYGVIKNNFTGVTMSIVDALKNVQFFRNNVRYQINKMLANSGGKAVVYDVAQKPAKIPLTDVFYHAKNSGLILINSKQEGNKYGSSFNQFQNVDFTLSTSVGTLLNLDAMLDETADRMTGISAARSGVNKSSDLVGVNERNVIQSTLITAPLYECHYSVVSQVMNGLANLMPFAWGNEDKMVNIFGDTGMMTWKISKDIALDEYGIFVKNNAKDIQDRNMMLGLIQNYSNNQAIDPLTAIKAVRMTSTTEMENILENGIKEMRAGQLQIEQQKTDEIKRQNDLLEKSDAQKWKIAQLESDTDIKVAEIQSEGGVIKTDQQMRGNREVTDMKVVGKLRETEMKEQFKFNEKQNSSKPAAPKKPSGNQKKK